MQKLEIYVSMYTVCKAPSACLFYKGIGSGPAGPVLAGPLFIKVKTKFHFAEVSNKQKR